MYCVMIRPELDWLDLCLLIEVTYLNLFVMNSSSKCWLDEL